MIALIIIKHVCKQKKIIGTWKRVFPFKNQELMWKNLHHKNQINP